MQQTTNFLTEEKIGIGSEFTLANKITSYAEYEAIWALNKMVITVCNFSPARLKKKIKDSDDLGFI